MIPRHTVINDRDTASVKKNLIKGTQQEYHRANGYVRDHRDFKKCYYLSTGNKLFTPSLLSIVERDGLDNQLSA